MNGSSSSATGLIGTTLGRVELQAVIGEGTAGVVYRGRHSTLGITVAVKVLKQDASSGDQHYRERFLREARLTARLEHPGIVRVIDCGEEHGHLFLVMDFVDGFSLGTYIERRKDPLTESTVLKILIAVANALQAAHQSSIIHRDLKPANLLLNRKGQLKLADLGLARESGMIGLTQERVRVGSPAYMSPEALTPGLEVDARSDLYALGVIAYLLVFGQLPYTGTIEQVCQGHLAGNARWDRSTQCSKATVRFVASLMARDRGERIQTAGEAANTLRPILEQVTKRYRKAKANASGSGSAGASASGSGDFTGLVKFMENRLGSHQTTVDGGQVVHTTKRERLLVWVLLIGVLALAIGGYLATQAGSDTDTDTDATDSASADETAADEPAAAVAPETAELPPTDDSSESTAP